MEKDTVLDYKRLEVKRVDEADEEIIALLENSVFGPEGGMQYSISDIAERIRSYGTRLFFMALYKKSDLAGVIGLCRRKTFNRGIECDSTYLRYLSIRSTYQAGELPRLPREKASHVEESFKQKLFSMFREPIRASRETEESLKPHVMYAYIESRNERSKNFVQQAGYEHIRSFLTVAFSRFNPSHHKDVVRLAAGDEQKMSMLLADYYKDYCFFSNDFSFFNHGYYVMKRNDMIIAGVCAIPTKYRNVSVPGVWGWVMMNILPILPYFRRLFRPGEFRYLALSSVYCRKGYEHCLPDLFDAVCAAENHRTALTWLDDHSGLYETLRTNRRMGALNRMLNAKPGLVYASFTNMSNEEKDKFYDSPAYIAGFDFS